MPTVRQWDRYSYFSYLMYLQVLPCHLLFRICPAFASPSEAFIRVEDKNAVGQGVSKISLFELCQQTPWTGSNKLSLQYFQFCLVGFRYELLFLSINTTNTNSEIFTLYWINIILRLIYSMHTFRLYFGVCVFRYLNSLTQTKCEISKECPNWNFCSINSKIWKETRERWFVHLIWKTDKISLQQLKV
jgi:hypothetical protein